MDTNYYRFLIKHQIGRDWAAAAARARFAEMHGQLPDAYDLQRSGVVNGVLRQRGIRYN